MTTLEPFLSPSLTFHNFHSCSGSYEDKTLGLYDDGDEFNKYVVWPCLSRSYFMVFNSQTRKGNDSLIFEDGSKSARFHHYFRQSVTDVLSAMKMTV